MTAVFIFTQRLFFSLLIFSCLAFAQAEKPGNKLPTKVIEKPETKLVVILGDSISEGYGVAAEKSYAKILENRFKAESKNVSVLNSSISGSTSASAPKRIQWIAKNKPQIVIIELGANDALRGLKPEETEKNLLAAIKSAKEQKIEVVLAGMKAPPNYGAEYSKKFESIFSNLSKKEKVKLIPFILEGVAGESNLNQSDGIHPNERGHKMIADSLYQFLSSIL